MTTRPAARAVVFAAVFAASWSGIACSPPGGDPTPTNTHTAPKTTEPQRQTTGSEPGCGPPTLRVMAPRDGDRVTSPFSIIYETECFSLNDGTIYLTTNGIREDLHPQTPAGTVTVSDHPMRSGRRTATIQLTDTNGRPLDNPEAAIVITIIIEGSRGAG